MYIKDRENNYHLFDCYPLSFVILIIVTWFITFPLVIRLFLNYKSRFKTVCQQFTVKKRVCHLADPLSVITLFFSLYSTPFSIVCLTIDCCVWSYFYILSSVAEIFACLNFVVKCSIRCFELECLHTFCELLILCNFHLVSC